MSSVVRGLVEGIGVTPVDEIPSDIHYFTEVAIPETVIIPEAKPDMEQLISVCVDAVVISKRLITTPGATEPGVTSNEGQHLAGYKLILELKLRQKVKYVADEPTQSVHAAHFEHVISSIFVVVPPTINETDINVLFKQNRLVITPYIEDIYAEMIDKRKIFKNITVLVVVKAI